MTGSRRFFIKCLDFLIRHPFTAVVSPLALVVFGLIISHEKEKLEDRKKDFPRALAAAEGEFRTHIDGATEFLYLLVEDYLAGRLEKESFDTLAGSYALNHPSIIRIFYSDKNYVFRWVVPVAEGQQILGHFLGIAQLRDASRKSRQQNRPIISTPFISLHGERAIAIFVPIYESGRFLGNFSCLFSLDGMIQNIFSEWITRDYQISLIDSRGAILSRIGDGKIVSSLNPAISGDLTGSDLFLQLVPFTSGVDWRILFFCALALGIIVGIALAIKELSMDLGRKKIKAEKLEQEKALAEAANEAKSQFVAKISHEIRTPLGAVIGYADLLLRPTTTMSEVSNGLQAIKRNGQNLLDLVNDLLDLSKIESGLLEIDAQRISLREVIAEALVAVLPLARSKSLEITAGSANLVPEFFVTDLVRLRQILVNLLGNAVKFTERGRVDLVCGLGIDSEGEPTLEFIISDTGIGIARDQVDTIFESFVQANRSVTQRFGGTGLGLSVARRLAHLLGGGLVLLKSDLGRGSTFKLSINPGDISRENRISLHLDPFSQFSGFSAPNNRADQGSRLLGLKVLLVEDGLDNQVIIKEYLESEGCVVCLANDGYAALEQAGRNEFDLILMDIQMPGIDGYETTKILKRRGVESPIVALTAYAMRGERERCINAGCADFLTKPIDANLLVSTIVKHTNKMKIKERTSNENAKATTETFLVNHNHGGQNMSFSDSKAPIVSTLAADPRVRKVLGGFIERLPGRVSSLRMSLNEKDWKTMGNLTHALKGTAGNYGFPDLAILASEIENQLNTEKSDRAIASYIDQLETLVIRAQEGFEAR